MTLREVKQALRKLAKQDPAAYETVATMIIIAADLTKRGLTPRGSTEAYEQLLRKILKQMRAEGPRHCRPTIDYLLKFVYTPSPSTRRRSVQ